MRFTIDRASREGVNVQPCANVTKTDRKDEIFRVPIWEIEISDLDALMGLVEQEGSLILSSTHITIYDDYVE